MKKSLNWLVNSYKIGLSANAYDEVQHRVSVINLFSMVGMSITGLMSISAIVNKNQLLALILACACFTFFVSFVVRKNSQNIKLYGGIIVYLLFALMVYLVYDGGVDNTGPIWIFMTAPVALFIQGFKRGLLEVGGFVLIISFLMFTPCESLLIADYSVEFKLRILYSYLTVTFLSAFYEHSRNSSYQYTLELSKKYQQLAVLDPLTKLSNRREGLQILEREQIKLKHTPEKLSLMLCDVDNFKAINDSYGHNIGDRVLVELASLFKSQVRAQDNVTRWGGEEFLFILPQTSMGNAIELANKLHSSVREISIQYQDHTILLSVSMGVSELGPEESISDAIDRADKCLYQAKKSGKDQTFPCS